MAWGYRRRYGGRYGRRYGYRRYRRYRSPFQRRLASFRRNVFKELRTKFPARGTPEYEEFIKSAPGTYPYTIEGMGDYKFSKRVKPSIGARIGAWVGDRGQSFLKRLTGFGDYAEASGPAPIHGLDPPIMTNQSTREVVISHREYIGDVVSGPAGTFSLQSYKINPGNPLTFPWLSSIASNFQQYRMQGCVFEFKTTSADALNSVNTALGQIIMATNYNVVQGDFQSKYEMENTEFANSCKPSASMMHAIECAKHLTVLDELYVAPEGNIPVGQPEQFCNFANFQIATNGLQGSNVNLGELWVTYEVCLMKPIVPSVAGVTGGVFLRYSATSAATSTAISNVTPLAVFRAPAAINVKQYPSPEKDAPYYLQPLNDNTMRIVMASGDTSLVGRQLALNWFYQILNCSPSPNSSQIQNFSTSTNVAVYNVLSNDGTSYNTAPNTATSPSVVGWTANQSGTVFVKVLAAGPIDLVFTPSTGNFPTTQANNNRYFDMHVYEVPELN